MDNSQDLFVIRLARCRHGAATVARETSTQDRRIQKTRGLLHEALATLVREKSYDAVSVKDILDRANVGRSTFYMHFSSKDELLASTIRDMLLPIRSTGLPSATGRHEDLVGFSLPIFEHVHRHQSLGKAPMGRNGRAVLHEHLQSAVAEWITDSLHKSSLGRRKATTIPTELVTQYVAATFTLVLNWWVESRSRLSPREVDGVFRALVGPTLQAMAL